MLACDDREAKAIVGAVSETKEALGAAWVEPDTLEGDALTEQIKLFFAQVRSLLLGENPGPINSAFDNYDLILFDYGLTILKMDIRLTADHVAGYLRAFSNTPYVVSLNKLPFVDFDLKYLVGDFESRADLALKTEHLSELGLWTGRNQPGSFCPYYWPTLNAAPELRNKQIAFIEADPDKPILEALGFPPSVVPFLSRQAIAFLSPDAEDLEGTAGGDDIRQVSFWHHFQRSNRSLPKDDRAALAGGQEVLDNPKCPNNPYLRTVVARVVAGELDFWFRRDVLGPQKLLIDAPHLQAHLRFRTDGGADDPDVWSSTAFEKATPFGLDPAIVDALPGEARFWETPWLDRPAFWLPLIENHEAIEALADGVPRNSNLVFCEDTRRFRERATAKRFVTELTKGLDVRFVEGVDGQEYSPRSLFAR
jgi:hypothetical protein